jgi:hypothetical protein
MHHLRAGMTFYPLSRSRFAPTNAQEKDIFLFRIAKAVQTSKPLTTHKQTTLQATATIAANNAGTLQ